MNFFQPIPQNYLNYNLNYAYLPFLFNQMHHAPAFTYPIIPQIYFTLPQQAPSNLNESSISMKQEETITSEKLQFSQLNENIVSPIASNDTSRLQKQAKDAGNSSDEQMDFMDESDEIEKYDEENKRTIRGKGLIWTKKEIKLLVDLYEKFQGKWSEIIKKLDGRNISQCSQKYRKIMKENVLNIFQIFGKYIQYQRKKNKWTKNEDETLLKGLEINGRDWVKITQSIKGRTCKQARDRYINKLDPNLNFGPWIEAEDLKIIELYRIYGKRWTMFSKILGNRSENQVKNRFYYCLQKKYIGKDHKYLQVHQIQQSQEIQKET